MMAVILYFPYSGEFKWKAVDNGYISRELSLLLCRHLFVSSQGTLKMIKDITRDRLDEELNDLKVIYSGLKELEKQTASDQATVIVGGMSGRVSYFLDLFSTKLDRVHSKLNSTERSNMDISNESVYKSFVNGVWLDGLFFDTQKPGIRTLINLLNIFYKELEGLSEKQFFDYYKNHIYLNLDYSQYITSEGITKIPDEKHERLFLIDSALKIICCSVLITEKGSPDFGAHEELAQAGYRVIKGESDSFGWLSGIIPINGKRFVYG